MSETNLDPTLGKEFYDKYTSKLSPSLKQQFDNPSLYE